MEDTGVIVPSFTQLCQYGGSTSKDGNHGGIAPCDLHFFGVYDGHGGELSQYSIVIKQKLRFCRRMLHQLICLISYKYMFVYWSNNL